METGLYKSPIGAIRISYSASGINNMSFVDEDEPGTQPGLFLAECFRQLDTYFAGTLTRFDLPLDLQGTPFQLRVWNDLLGISFGENITYKELAKRLGDPKSIRAAARANGQNPLPVIVPCHRVIGSDGNLTGYAAGLWRKKWLLEHERKNKQGKLF